MKINKKRVRAVNTHFNRLDGERHYFVIFTDGSTIEYDDTNVPDKVYELIVNVMPDQEIYYLSKIDTWRRIKRREK